MTSGPSLFHRALHIAVLGGGASPEREISLASAVAVRDGLAALGHEVTAVDPAETDLLGHDWTGIDAAYIALHGTGGEDGTTQRVLEHLGVPYTGSDAEASADAFAKAIAKARFRETGVPTPGWAVVHAGDHASDIRRATESVGYPLVVKPDGQGSSLGVSIVREPEDLSRAMARCFGYGDTGLVESYVPGTEWTVSVIDHLPLPLVRITSAGGFYDYDAKYETGETTYDVTFGDSVSESTLRGIRDAGTAACRALRTSGIARADVRLDDDGRPWVLEVNTVPGMTEQSLVPKAAAAIGISFAELCERSVACALAGRSAHRESARRAA